MCHPLFQISIIYAPTNPFSCTLQSHELCYIRHLCTASFFLQIAPNVVLTDEEIEYRQKLEYQAYLDEESNFLRELGLKEEIEEPLPAVE